MRRHRAATMVPRDLDAISDIREAVEELAIVEFPQMNGTPPDVEEIAEFARLEPVQRLPLDRQRQRELGNQLARPRPRRHDELLGAIFVTRGEDANRGAGRLPPQ